MSQQSVFDEFTRKYSLSKTLRFELIPTENTGKYLESSDILKKDKVIAESYQKAKPYFDRLHRDFIEEALGSNKKSLLSLDSFEEAWEAYRQNKKEAGGKFANAQKNVCKMVVKLLDEYAEEWKKKYAPKAKKSGTDLLCSSEILPILKSHFPTSSKDEGLFIQNEDGNRQYIFDIFNGFTTYLGKFQQTRKNFYKDDGTSTAVATRVVENLAFFLDNKKKIEKYIGFIEKFELSDEELNIGKTSFYLDCLNQSGIEKYNKLIGELNSRIQKLRDQSDKSVRREEYPLLKKLYNQILAEKKTEEDNILIENMEGVMPAFANFCSKVDAIMDGMKALMIGIVNDKYGQDKSGIYINNRAINTISRRWFIDSYEFEISLPQKGRSKDGAVKVASFVSLADIERAIEGRSVSECFKEQIIKEFELDIKATSFSQFLLLFSGEFEKLASKYREKQRIFFQVNLDVFDRGEGDINVDRLKEVLESGLGILQVAKYFALSSKKAEDKPVSINNEFYNQYSEWFGEPDEKHVISSYYDAFRNFLTKKPDSKEKIKLNFGKGTLLSGFSKSKEPEKLGIILRKGSEYYLGIINKDYNKIFDDQKHAEFFDVVDGDAYEKMEYNLFPDPKRMIPKIAFAANNRERFGWKKEIQDIKDEFARFQKSKQEDTDSWSEKFDPGKLVKLIQYYQKALEIDGYKKIYNFSWKSPDAYQGLGEFNDDIAKKSYRINFRKVSQKYVAEKERKGELYLFRIHNKDFSTQSSGAKNIHTLYFLNLFSDQNLSDPAFRLAGNAEVFLRECLVEKQKEKRNFPRPITRYKRFTERKYFFHIPIMINGTNGVASEKRINNLLNTQIVSRHKMHVIGIDRGEKHLAYYSIIDENGSIVEQRSFNEIRGVKYFEKLLSREKERLEQRRSWKSISRIRDLKRGYISQIVHELATLIVEHNAVIVFEDLNLRFKEIRSGIERSVYQQLEKAVIEKLSYLVFKDNHELAAGGVLNGYQLATPVQSFADMKKQNGIIFYVNPEYTSTTDPVTGWRRHIYISSRENDTKLLKRFTEEIQIGWDESRKSYTFTYDENDFVSKGKSSVSRKWKLYANVPRIEKYRNNLGYWEARVVNPNDLLRELFVMWDFKHEEVEVDISEQIAIMFSDKLLQGEREVHGKRQRFFKALRYIFNLVQQIRNSDSMQYVYDRDSDGNVKKNSDGTFTVKAVGENVDFIASPVNPFFTTPSKYTEENLCGLNIENGDANGAYNIARKGRMLLNRVKDNPERPNLYISRKEWDDESYKQWNEKMGEIES